jgi:hypothetical protein
MEKLVDGVVRELWNRDGAADPQFASHLNRARTSALWYVRQYMSSQSCPLPEPEEMVAVLAAVFITFKAADYIPGTGRVKMHQLLEAYERFSKLVFAEPETARVIEQVCKTEMDIMCLSGFNFNPC